MTKILSDFVEGFAAVVLLVFCLVWQVAFLLIPVALAVLALDWLGVI